MKTGKDVLIECVTDKKCPHDYGLKDIDRCIQDYKLKCKECWDKALKMEMEDEK